MTVEKRACFSSTSSPLHKVSADEAPLELELHSLRVWLLTDLYELMHSFEAVFPVDVSSGVGYLSFNVDVGFVFVCSFSMLPYRSAIHPVVQFIQSLRHQVITIESRDPLMTSSTQKM